MSYTPTIGLEVHAELNTESKMFCGCKNEPHDAEINKNVCPVCMAHPGTLPVPNKKAIEMVFLFGRAVGAQAADFSEFDRKNYFYPDIPKAYQISQYAYPFLTGGQLESIELTRVHLEEDTARSQHDKGSSSLVDFNRAGVPLMELVTEPVIHDAKVAGSFARELQLLLRTLKISTANMEKGEMRVEANISVSKTDTFGTKVEVKNLNSFKSVESAIEYEISRQIEMLEKGEEIAQETRGWDEDKSRTFSQRTKETAKDYRYFPDPDIPKIISSADSVFHAARLDEIMPVLPSKKRELYGNLGMTSEMVEVLLADSDLDDYLANALTHIGSDPALVKLTVNYLTTDVSAITGSSDLKLNDLPVTHFVELIQLVHENKIGSRVAKDLLPDLFGSEMAPEKLATDRGLLQVSDASELGPVIDQILSENEAVVEQYLAGKEASLQYLVGQGMKLSRGAANPGVLRDEIIKKLSK
jgi:aspartyl-tRNA(Asn)/glutamyl-tRNA(Gln) amidotransferase subunit B